MELEARLGAAFLTGLLSSGHCFGMCGGIAGALALGRSPAGGGAATRVVAHSLGRIGTYVALGLAAGAFAGLAGARLPAEWARVGARLVAALCFAGLALYLLGHPGLLAPLERTGARLFRLFEPLRRRLFGRATFAAALASGSLWGFLPCGLVYSSLLFAVTAGSAPGAALTMLAFGVGTLPALVAAGLASRTVAAISGGARGAIVRRVAAALYLVAALALGASAVGELGAGAHAPTCHPGGAAAAQRAPDVSAAGRPAGS